MKKFFSFVVALAMLFSSVVCNAFAESAEPLAASGPRKMEYLTRGAFGAYLNGNVYLSWRLLGTEPMDTKFNVYCNGTLLAGNVDNTNYTHSGGSLYNKYQVAAVVNGEEQALSSDITVMQGYADTPCKGMSSYPYTYFDIPIQAPEPVNCNYYDANDASVGDLDGDGEYEVVLKWNPDNSKDNSEKGSTGNVFIDAYEMDGTRLWRIDLGPNIRAGAHYTQFMVYDFDSDGKAEVAMKTAPGSKDNAAKFVTAVGNTDAIKSADNTKVYRNGRGYIIDGPEYLTIFNGQTGNAMQTINYKPSRGSVSSWGDSYGNRVDRFLAGVAYLDGVHPSLIMSRGYYTRVAIAAYDWDGTNLKEHWYYDTNNLENKKSELYGQGNHQMSIADLDNDGRDEIVFGSAALDDDGKMLHTTRFGHGDALHVSDFDNDGKQEIFAVLEEKPNFGANYREGDGKTDLWQKKATEDTGRGIMIVSSEKYGAIGWSSQSQQEVFRTDGSTIPFKKDGGANFGIWWDGDYLREYADGAKLSKWVDRSDNGGDIKRIWNAYDNSPVVTNNTTKNTPCLQADLFGDWREEIIYRHSDNSALRVFASITPSNYKFTTLMHDSQYRCAVAWQNTGYNQPPHQSYYIGPGMSNPTQPNIEMVSSNRAEFTITDSSGKSVSGAKIYIDGRSAAVTNSSGVAEAFVSPGKHTYSVKCTGYIALPDKEFEIKEETDVTKFSATIQPKTNCDISVSYVSVDGKTIKQSQKLGNVPIKTKYELDDKYKEDIIYGNTVYEYNADLSFDTEFDAVDDTEVKLVFSEKFASVDSAKEVFRTNFSKNGFSKNSEKHGYSVAGEFSYAADSNGVKYAVYDTSNGNITVNIPDGVSDFVAEFDMAFMNGGATQGSDVYGVTPFSGDSQGTTVGIRLSGGNEPYFGSDWGSDHFGSKNKLTPDKIYRYIFENDGNKMYMTVGDKATGEIVVPRQEIGVNGSVGTSKKIDKFVIGAGKAKGTAKIGIGDFRIYKIVGPNITEWPFGENIDLNIPSSTKISSDKLAFKTGFDTCVIDLAEKPVYKILNADDTETSGSAVTVSADGVVNVAQDAQRADYKLKCIYKENTIKTYNLRVIKNDDVKLYDSTAEEKLNLFKYNSGEGASGTPGSNKYTFVQNNSDGGREFLADFFPTNSGKATLKYTIKVGYTKPAATDAARAYNFETQFLDASYNGENPDEHTVLGLSQEVEAEAGDGTTAADLRVKELQYYGKTINKTLVRNPDNQYGSVTPSITARTSTTLGVTVDFDFDSGMASLLVIKDKEGDADNGCGYKYDNIPISGGFRGLRFATEGDAVIDLKLEISNLSYTKHIYAPDNIDKGTIRLKNGAKSFYVTFKEPDVNDSPVNYHVFLTDENGVTLPEIVSSSAPVVVKDVEPGNYKYSVRIYSENKLGKSQEVSTGLLNVTVFDKMPIVTSIKEDFVSNGKINFKAVVTNNTTESINGTIVAAIYDKAGKLINTKYAKNEFKAGENTVPFELQTNGNEKFTLKTFIWNGVDKMTPIENSDIFSKEY